MKKKTVNKKGSKEQMCRKSKCDTSMGCVYGLGLLGAAIYYISTATSFGAGILGVLKALVWPAFLVFELFKFLGM